MQFPFSVMTENETVPEACVVPVLFFQFNAKLFYLQLLFGEYLVNLLPHMMSI